MLVESKTHWCTRCDDLLPVNDYARFCAPQTQFCVLLLYKKFRPKHSFRNEHCNSVTNRSWVMEFSMASRTFPWTAFRKWLQKVYESPNLYFRINRYIRLLKKFFHIYIDHSCFKMTGNVTHTRFVATTIDHNWKPSWILKLCRISYFSPIREILHPRGYIFRGISGKSVTNKSSALEIFFANFGGRCLKMFKESQIYKVFHC